MIDTVSPTPKSVSAVPRFDDPSTIPDGQLGRFDQMLIRPNRASPDVLVLFNGAVDQKRRTDAAVFQRWSWGPAFAASLVWVQDPLVSLGGDCGLAWYVGRRDGPTFQDQLADVGAAIEAVRPGARRVAFGSSGGGFAALMSAACDWSSAAIAVNPQLNILKYSVGKVDLFLRDYGVAREALTPADALRLSVGRRLGAAGPDGASVLHIFQNRHDRVHVERHFSPLARAVARAPDGLRQRVRFHDYDDPTGGHNPPPREGTLDLIRLAEPGLLA